MSDHLIQVFMGDTPVHLEGAEVSGEGDRKTLWKAVLRTGVWKLRPGPGGTKLSEPLKIYRDKAPKGHISMASLKANFEAGAKENVTIPVVHADGTTSDSGFVRRLVIQDVAGEDGSQSKESLLWAEMDITDSEVRRKVEEKSLVGVSGGILFDYERTEDAKKFDQILSHVMVTNSPWINGTGGFQDKLPEGVMASESDDLPISEVEFSSRETDPLPQLPVVKLDNPPPDERRSEWKPEQGLEFSRTQVRQALDDSRQALMARLPEKQRYMTDWPTFSVSDISLAGEGGTALITSGYGSELDTWVAMFKFDSNRKAELEPFVKWVAAKREWVGASEEKPLTAESVPRKPKLLVRAISDLGLEEAKAARAERMNLGDTSPTTGGHMGLTDLLSRADLSDEDRELIRAEAARIAQLEANEASRREDAKLSEVVAYCGTSDGEIKGKLDKLGLDDPGVKKYVRNVILSDDGGAAIELSEHLGDGRKTAGVAQTAVELLKGFIDILPKADDGRVSLAEQARRLPDDPKPPETNEPPKEDPIANADALLAELHSQGFGENLVAPKGA